MRSFWMAMGALLVFVLPFVSFALAWLWVYGGPAEYRATEETMAPISMFGLLAAGLAALVTCAVTICVADMVRGAEARRQGATRAVC